MSEPWDELKDVVLGSIKESLKEFADRQEVQDFAKEKAKDFAKQKYLAATAKDESKRREHEANLKHLLSQVVGEACRLEVAVAYEAREWIGKVLRVAGEMLLRTALGAIKGI